jgi:hypothetical protein
MRGAAIVAVMAAACLSCDDNCDEAVPIVSGEYTIGAQLYESGKPDDDWTRAVVPGAQQSVDLASNTATVVYEREGTTYQVVFKLEK